MKCFLIAKKLGHSFSRPIHNALADYEYDYKELEETELDGFFKEKDFDGLNVTIPYKQTVIKYLDFISPEAQRIGAVNTIVNRGGKLMGYNTDYYGFMYEIEESGAEIKGRDVVILGRGGASKTAKCVCEELGAKSVRLLTREHDTPEKLAQFYNAQIVINATPVGMYPNTGESAVDITSFTKCEAALDLIYNPANTKLILDAKRMGMKTANGLGMLVAQAKKACEIFTDSTVDDEKIAIIRKDIEKQTKNIILIGMPGSGKSTVGRELAQCLGREFFDSDDEIAKLGRTPAQIIETEGEAAFRKLESRVLSKLCKKSGCVIAAGGGVVTEDRNFDIIHQNATVVFIARPVKDLATDGRPLSQGGADKLIKMYEVRLPLYKKFCHIEVGSQNTWQETAQIIIAEINNT